MDLLRPDSTYYPKRLGGDDDSDDGDKSGGLSTMAERGAATNKMLY